MSAVLAEVPSISCFGFGEVFGLGDEVQHVKAESLHAFSLPEADNILQLFADFGIFPVEVGLLWRKQVKIPFPDFGSVIPCSSAEASCPFCRGSIRLSVPEDIVVHVFRVSGKGALEPFVLV